MQLARDSRSRTRNRLQTNTKVGRENGEDGDDDDDNNIVVVVFPGPTHQAFLVDLSRCVALRCVALC